MGSEDQVQELMVLIDRALVEAEKIEGVLDSYDKELEVQYILTYQPSYSVKPFSTGVDFSPQKTTKIEYFGAEKVNSKRIQKCIVT